MKRWSPLVAGIVCVLIGVGLYIVLNPATCPTKFNSVSSIIVLKKQISSSLTKCSADKMYTALKESIGKTSKNGHASAHVFGQELYASLGKEGLKVCDPSYNYGCYHGFFASFLSDKGPSALKSLDQSCKKTKNPILCQHGIGHGLLEYYSQNVSKALDVCQNLSWHKKLYGCQDGVFMEYNFPAVIGSSFIAVPREFNKRSAYAVCETVSERYKLSCYYNLPQWWTVVLKNDFKKVNSLCSAIENLQWQKACFVGVSEAILHAAYGEYKVDKLVNICEQMPQNKILLCRSSLSWLLSSLPEFSSVSKGLCKDRLSLDEQNQCFNYKNIYSDLID